MTAYESPFIPHTKMGSVVPSSPLQSPLHPPSQTHPHTPYGFAPAMTGGASLMAGKRTVAIGSVWTPAMGTIEAGFIDDGQT